MKITNFIFILLFFFQSSLANSANIRQINIINDDNKKINFNVEIADTQTKRNKGLMHRKYMPENSGMLFIFEKARKASFWMKNTYISLDILFIDENNIIENIIKNTKPLSLDYLESKGKVKLVLEINAGLTDKYNIKIGNKLAENII